MLAINGGKKVREKLFPAQETFGLNEIHAVLDVFKRGRLSYYRGNAGESFWGGPKVQEFEKLLQEKFNVKYSLAVNSCTSALYVACGAIGLKPGDEVIVTPWSMSCSASMPMAWGATPVFADIEPDYFCLDYEDVKRKITKKTKAIIVVDLFGQPFDYRIKELAAELGIFVIEDAAQSIGSKYKDLYAGTIGDIGCFSFTQGKHLTCGEGGAIVTNNKSLAVKASMIRNHAESVTNDLSDPLSLSVNSVEWFSGLDDYRLFGLNMRMPEIEAAIMCEQLERLDDYVEMRQDNADKLNCIIGIIPGISSAKIRDNCTHSYYVAAYLYDEKIAGVERNKFIEAVKAELSGENNRIDKGVPIGCGYIKPLNRFPLFDPAHADDCPVADRLYNKELFLTTLQGLPLTSGDHSSIEYAFVKVYSGRNEV